MKRTKRRGVGGFVGLASTIAAFALLPSTALAAHEAITVAPVGADGTTPSLTANSSPTLNLSAGFDKTKTLTSASFNLAPGLMLNFGALGACVTSSTPPDFSNDAACDAGTGEIDLTAEVSLTGGAPSPISGVTATGDIFLAPPAAGTNDIAVLDVHITKVVAPLVGEEDQVIDAPIHVTMNPDGSLSLNASNLPTSITSPTLGTVGLQITGIKASFDSTVTANGTDFAGSTPFVRLPTSCGKATSTLDATYSDGSTGTGSDSFTPTDCGSVAYKPSLLVQGTADASGNVNSVTLSMSHPQPFGTLPDGADKSVKFALPPASKLNAAAFTPGQQVGTLDLSSFLLPSTNLLTAPLMAGGTAAAPTLTASLPGGPTYTGSVDLADNTITFSNLPDLTPFDLRAIFTGANGAPVLTSDCSSNVNGIATFIGQADQVVSSLINPIGCADGSPPTLATAESMTVTPSDPAAGASPALSADLVFNSTAPPATSVEVDLAPGLLSDIAADSSCLTGAPQFTTACHIGVETDTEVLLGIPLPALAGDAFLVAPPASKDIAGIDIHLPSNAAGTDTVWGVSVDPSTGGLVLDDPSIPTALSLGSTSLPAQQDEIDLVFDAGSISQLPTGCGPAKSSFTVTYTDANGDNTTGSASGTVTPTGCANEPYAPTLSASVVGNGGPGAAEVKLDSTQKADEAADESIKLSFPSSLKLGSGSGQVGTASATTTLSPKPLSGTVTESGQTLKVAFPAPVGLTLTGTVSGNTITFSNLPDVRISDLSLDLKGLFQTDCTAGSVTGAFGGQGGQSHTATAQLQFSDCTPASTGGGSPGGTGTTPTSPTKPTNPTTPTKPTTPTTPRNHVKAPKKAKGSGTVKGLASGHPTVSLKVTLPAGQKAKSLTVALPKGLKFAKAAFAKHKVSGLKLGGGAKAASVKLKAGKLVIALKKPVHSLSIKVSGKLVTASGAVAASKHHKPLTLTVRATTTNHKTDTVKITLKG